MTQAQLFDPDPKHPVTMVLVDHDGAPLAAVEIEDAGDRWDVAEKWLYVAWREHLCATGRDR